MFRNTMMEIINYTLYSCHHIQGPNALEPRHHILTLQSYTYIWVFSTPFVHKKTSIECDTYKYYEYRQILGCIIFGTRLGF